MRRAAVAMSLALLVGACTTSPTAQSAAPSDPVAREAVAIRASSTQPPDKPFDDFIASVDFAKAYGSRANSILDQIRKTRAAVEVQGTHTASQGPRLASVSASAGNFSFAQFAFDFGFVLDQLTRKGGDLSYPANHLTATESDANTTTTTTLAVTETFSGAGSVVTGSVRWNYTTITIDTTPTGGGATIFHLTDDREFTGTIDVCPDGGGNVPATLIVSSKIKQDSGGATTTSSSTGNGSFKGSVNDQAALTSVTQDSRSNTSFNTSAGAGGSTSEVSASWTPSSSGFADLDVGSFKARIEAKGVTSAADAAKAAGWDTALGMFAVEPAFTAARDLWRAGRCVVVAVAQWNAETPIQTQDQTKSQHKEEVDVSSDTKFNASLKHRFAGGAISKTTTAVLTDGKEKISPDKLETGAGQLTYKAGDEDDKEATLQLKSTSNRGIGTLVLTFHTSGKVLTLSVQGTQELGPTREVLRTTLSIGPAVFAKKDEKTWEATAPFSGTSVLVPPDKDCPGLTITQGGTLVLHATKEKRGEQEFWIVTYAPGGNSKVTGSGCDEDVTKAFSAGGAFGAGLFLANVGDIVIPIDGGTVPLSGSAGTGKASGTATATVTKKG